MRSNATVLVQTYHLGVCKVAVLTIPGSIADIKSTVVWIVVGFGSDATLVCGYCWVFRHGQLESKLFRPIKDAPVTLVDQRHRFDGTESRFDRHSTQSIVDFKV